MPVIEPVPASPDFPKHADAVVIGAGIIGIATALELQQRGLSVVVLEKGEVAAEQSSRNWGWCRQMGRDPRELPLIKISLDLWRGMNKRLAAETGFRTCGIAYLAETENQLAQHANWVLRQGQCHGLSTRLVSASEAAALVPGSSLQWKGGIFTPDDGRAEPFVAVPAMAKFFQGQGGKIFTRCAARGIETKAGKLCSVATENGSIATDTVIVAGGYWSSRFLGNLGIRFPQLGVVNSVMRTAPLDIGHERTFSGNRFAVRKRNDGGFTVAHNHFSVAELTPQHFRFFMDFLPMLKLEHRAIKLRVGKRLFDEWQLASTWKLDQPSPFELLRVLDPEPYEDVMAEALQGLQKAYPVFQGVQILERWGGMIDATPDAVPVIDKIDSIPGLHLASGFSGHGFGLGPGAGKLMAEIVTSEKPCVDPQPFRFARFSDGTKHSPTTGV
jgi:glycine/D-amino acid oxidase-like deaminating enzyme